MIGQWQREREREREREGGRERQREVGWWNNSILWCTVEKTSKFLTRLISLRLDTLDGLTIAHYGDSGLDLLTVISNNRVDLLQATVRPFPELDSTSCCKYSSRRNVVDVKLNVTVLSVWSSLIPRVNPAPLVHIIDIYSYVICCRVVCFLWSPLMILLSYATCLSTYQFSFHICPLV